MARAHSTGSLESALTYGAQVSSALMCSALALACDNTKLPATSSASSSSPPTNTGGFAAAGSANTHGGAATVSTGGTPSTAMGGAPMSSGGFAGAGASITAGSAGQSTTMIPDAGTDTGAPPITYRTDFRPRAQDGMPVLQRYYDTASGLYNGNLWWTGANMLEVTIDYSRELGDMTYVDTIDNTFEKVKGGSFQGFVNFLNEYYDDEGWWALAWIKAYDLTHNAKYLDMAKVIFQDMTQGWNPNHCNGGLYWRKTDETKNAIPNELFLTVAARLHLRTANDMGTGGFLDWAQREWAWFKASGMIQADNQIVDGMNGQCAVSGPAYTYNQGVIVGGLVDLWRSTGDAALMDQAVAIARAAISHQTTPDGVFIEAVCDPNCGGGDGLQFKGIFARNIAYLYEANPLPELRDFLIVQSDAIWNLSRSAANEFGKRWAGPFDEADPSRQSSALDAVIGAVRVANMNLALTGTTTGSVGCTAQEEAARATDGSSRFDSKWCSAGMSGQELTVDLGSPQLMVGFAIRHAGDAGEAVAWNTRDFAIETSTDASHWAPAVNVIGNTDNVTFHPIAARRARYARLKVNAAQSSMDLPAARIYEFEVVGIERQ